MMKTLFSLMSLLALSACATTLQPNNNPAEVATQFTQKLLNGEKDTENWVTADIAFLHNHTQNSPEGKRIIRQALQMMGQYIRQSIEEANIDSNNVTISSQDTHLDNNGKLATVTLFIYESNINPSTAKTDDSNEPEEDSAEKIMINAAQLITRWRYVNNQWKLDLNPYLDNFRYNY